MSLKRTYSKKKNKAIPESNENEKENIYSRLRKRQTRDDVKNSQMLKTDSDEEFEKLLLSPQKEDVNLKPLTFWSKKLKDLESQKDNEKKKKIGLYELTITDDSQSPFLNNKKQRKKKVTTAKIKNTETRKKNTKVVAKKPKTKVDNEINFKNSLLKEQLLLNKEEEMLSGSNNKFTFSTIVSSLGVTSTPSLNKINLIGASNFMFLSPVLKEEIVNLNENKKSVAERENETPKKNTRLQNMPVRVLRNRKLVI